MQPSADDIYYYVTLIRVFNFHIKMPFPGYAPPVYTASDVIHDPDWADTDLLE